MPCRKERLCAKQWPCFLILLGSLCAGRAEYLRAPEEIGKILAAPRTPSISVNPARTHALLLEADGHPSIAELAQPMLRLAGHRINPRNNAERDLSLLRSVTLVDLASLRRTLLAFPAEARLGRPVWLGSGAWFAIAAVFPARVELWRGEVASGRVSPVPNLRLNAALGVAGAIVPAGPSSVYAAAIPKARGAPPQPPAVPPGPVTQESTGKASDTWTFQDMLSSPHDEDLFDFYATSEIVKVNLETGAVSFIGKPAVYRSFSLSPGGEFLLVQSLRRPYSYLVPSEFFPLETAVWTSQGKHVYTVASQPLADAVSMDGVRTGPRAVAWRPDQPATLVWIEALDGGNPRETAAHRDRVMTSSAPFHGVSELRRVQHRLTSIRFTEGGMLLAESQREKRWVRSTFVPSIGQPVVVDDRASRDRYRNPGDPLLETLPSGHRVLLRDGDFAWYSGEGATPAGDRPFLDKVNLRTLEKRRVFQSEEGAYERVLALLDREGSRMVTLRESPVEPPNLYLRAGGRRSPLTTYPDPAPRLRRVRQQLVTYKRDDGVALSFTLYLPPDYQPGSRLPTVFYAYPQEFNDPDTAGQVASSAGRFTLPRGASHLWLLLAGYAILDRATLPVVGSLETANDTYIEQIAAGARAAIDKAVEIGVTDRDRVGVTGHSYGGFMTANLLAHTDLFRAGVARSGAYNRTLTPFGFQGERRTFWRAPGVYTKMSPFFFAHRINEPVLFIHGAVDDNTGTHPLQSERMYQAVRGNGGIARLLMLPHESHSYSARESVEHVIAETIAWFDRYVKKAPPR